MYHLPCIDYLKKYPIHFTEDTSYEKFKIIFLDFLKRLDHGVTEIYMHPADLTLELKNICHSRACLKRYYEYRLLQDEDLAKTLEQENINLIGWENIS